jgi:hypothetical protein
MARLSEGENVKQTKKNKLTNRAKFAANTMHIKENKNEKVVHN